MQNLTVSRLYYIGVWCVAALLAAAFETDALASGFIPSSPTATYAASMVCTVLTIVCTWGALRLFAFRAIKGALKAKPDTLGRWNAVRTTVLAIGILGNLLVYYGTFTSSALYALFITLVGFVFCWPKHNEVAAD